MVKKKILIQTDKPLAKTGFARNAKAVLSYLYKTGKYEIIHVCCSTIVGDDSLERVPWKCYAGVPTTEEANKMLSKMPKHEAEIKAKQAGYGVLLVDEIVRKERPDIYIGVQDIWGIDFAITHPWFKHINTIFWTTLDSLPIIESAVNASKRVDAFWVWSNFAEKAMRAQGIENVKTVHGAIDTSAFFPKSDEDKTALRKRFGLSDEFIVGFVFRNQGRKSVGALIKGYKLFKDENPGVKSKLLLHTHWGEGWDIQKLMKEQGIPKEEVITTYICPHCKHWGVKPFESLNDKCPSCQKNGFTTTQTGLGITEDELNDVYNLMDVYCHPFTSGGQEVPIQEAKLAGLITCVTSYSCGEEMCEPEAFSIPLSWEEYREMGSCFIKAATSIESIKSALTAVYKMPAAERKVWGEKATEWAKAGFSAEAVGKIIEDHLDNNCNKTWDYADLFLEKDEKAQVENLPDNTEWVKTLYRNILKVDVHDLDSGLEHWVKRLEGGEDRKAIENYFRKVAAEEKVKKKKKQNLLNLAKLPNKKLAFLVPEAEKEVYYAMALLKSAKETYKDYDIYFITKRKYFYLLLGNPYIHSFVEYEDEMSQPFFLEGKGNEVKYFDIVLNLSNGIVNYGYLRNGEDRKAFDLCIQ